MSTYDVRLARESELDLLASVERAAAMLFQGTPYATLAGSVVPREYLQARRRAGAVWVAVATEPVGFAVASVVAHSAYLDELDVHPDHGRRGLGRRLIDCAAEWARREGHDDLLLSTFSSIAWNAPYYSRLGFRVLQADEYADAQSVIRESERERGLPVRARVIMARRLT